MVSQVSTDGRRQINIFAVIYKNEYISDESFMAADRYVTPLGYIILIPDQQIDMSRHSDTLS
jgi:hypothetical protein